MPLPSVATDGVSPSHVPPEGSFAREAYGEPEISERHRHRYEFNRDYEKVLTEGGLRIAGQTPDSVYVEICEIPGHPWFLGCQFHPEFKSKPLAPHPLFASFINASYEHRMARSTTATTVVTIASSARRAGISISRSGAPPTMTESQPSLKLQWRTLLAPVLFASAQATASSMREL